MTDTKSGPIRIEIKFQRIQTYLFAIPRLKAMLGANAVLGKIIRKTLPDSCAGFTESLNFPFPLENPCDDPLDHASCDDDLKDNPGDLYLSGILSRDGGHFIVVAKDDAQRERFIGIVHKTLAECPGLRYTIETCAFAEGPEAASTSEQSAPTILDPNLPVFEICRETGVDWASEKKKASKNQAPSEEVPISERAERLIKAGTEFYMGGEKDLISLLSEQFPGHDREFKKPNDLEDFSKPSGGYLALIQIDGNQIGRRLNRRKEHYKDQEPAHREARNEVFFHALRVAMREGLVSALRSTFDDVPTKTPSVIPYQVLMLGGDDLLVLTRPEFALRFVKHLARALRDKKIPFLQDQARPVSFAASVVIAKHNLPFYRLAEISDALLAGAKRLYRSQTLLAGNDLPPERSTVDWNIATASWLDNLDAYRKAQEFVEIEVDGIREQLALTSKPYFILPGPEGDDPLDSLSGLLDAADALRFSMKRDPATREAPKLARSQLRELVNVLGEGHRWSQWKFDNIPDAGRAALEKHAGMKNLWHSLDDPDPDKRTQRFVTRFADLVEILEIPKLGKRDDDQ